MNKSVKMYVAVIMCGLISSLSAPRLLVEYFGSIGTPMSVGLLNDLGNAFLEIEKKGDHFVFEGSVFTRNEVKQAFNRLTADFHRVSFGKALLLKSLAGAVLTEAEKLLIPKIRKNLGYHKPITKSDVLLHCGFLESFGLFKEVFEHRNRLLSSKHAMIVLESELPGFALFSERSESRKSLECDDWSDNPFGCIPDIGCTVFPT